MYIWSPELDPLRERNKTAADSRGSLDHPTLVIQMVVLRNIMRYLDEIAPRDHSVHGLDRRIEIGPQTEEEQLNTTVNRVLVATYPSARVVTRASQDRVNLLITGRPLFSSAISRLDGLDLIRVRILTKNYITSCYVGSCWAAAKNGLTDALVEHLDLKYIDRFYVVGDYEDTVPLGRICEPTTPTTHAGFGAHLAKKTGLDGVMFVGDPDEPVKRILVIVGTYVGTPEIVQARMIGIKTLVTGELSPQTRLFANECGINTFEMGPFVTEEPGMHRLRHMLSLQFPDLRIEHAESPPYARILRGYVPT